VGHGGDPHDVEITVEGNIVVELVGQHDIPLVRRRGSDLFQGKGGKLETPHPPELVGGWIDKEQAKKGSHQSFRRSITR
jgi:hypothetical protein